jgi:signal transduction histidine kinase/DNA-binding NarL/FixJ family response regulator
VIDAPVRLLLVDDRPENLLALEAILEPLGQIMVRATSGEEALRQVLVNDFAVILLDVQMPGMNGFETAKLIKAREKTRHIPIIFLTAISKEERYVFEGYSVGAVDYMSKPFQPDILRSKVMVFVDLYRKQRQLADQEQLLREHERRELELRHRAELSEREARFGEIVGSAMDAIISFDASRRVTLFNAAAERMFGRAADDVMGRDIALLFPTRQRAAFVSSLHRGGRDDEPDGDGSAASPGQLDARPLASFAGARADGEEFPIEASLSRLDLPQGTVYTLIARDVSERRRAEAALRAKTESLAVATDELTRANAELSRRQAELEQAMNARSRFYASMSHELRTPINAILGYNTLLLEHIYGPLNEKQAEGLKRTQRAAKHLLELVNDVLDLSKIEANKIELKPQPVVFPALIEDLFVTVRPMADERGSELTLEYEGDPVTVVTDPRRVRQILLNLLSNAIKFGRGQPIRIVCARQGTGVRIEVIDRGVGIALEDQPKIFDEFVQLSRTPQHEGTGLGLPISRRLAQLLHGTLEVVSAPGEGSCFRVVIPALPEVRSDVRVETRASRLSGDREVEHAGVRPSREPAPAPAPAGQAPAAQPDAQKT